MQSAESMFHFQTSVEHFLCGKYANKLSQEQGVIFLLIVASCRKGLTFTSALKGAQIYLDVHLYKNKISMPGYIYNIF